MALLVLAVLIFSGCSTTQLNQANVTYHDAHRLRIATEEIPGVVPVVDQQVSWAPDARVALDVVFDVEDALYPEPLSLSSLTQTAR